MRIAASIPIDPDSQTAHDWIVEELARDPYNGGDLSWLDRFWEWLSRLFDGLRPPSGDTGIGGVPGSVIAIAVGVVLLGAIIYIILGPVRRSRAAKKSHAVFDDDDRSAAVIRDAAQAAAARGDWTDAVVERFRGLVRGVEDAGWVPVVPGMTAYEFVTEAGGLAPALAGDLAWAGDLFDGIRYGQAGATRTHYERMTDLDERASKAKVVAVLS